MKFSLELLLTLLLLSGQVLLVYIFFGQHSPVAHEYHYPELHKTTTVTFVHDPALVTAKFFEYYRATGITVRGLAEIKEDECVVYSYLPRSDEDWKTEVFGHEVLHCFGMRH